MCRLQRRLQTWVVRRKKRASRQLPDENRQPETAEAEHREHVEPIDQRAVTLERRL
jgi:hypothetical protein